MYLWAWFILTVIFTVAAMRSSWVLLLDLFFLDIVLLLLACGYLLNDSRLETAGSALGFVVAFLSCKFRLPAFENLLINEQIGLGLRDCLRMALLLSTFLSSQCTKKNNYEKAQTVGSGGSQVKTWV
jgi:hypothetical protein